MLLEAVNRFGLALSMPDKNRLQNRSWRNPQKTHMKKLITVIGSVLCIGVINIQAQSTSISNAIPTISFLDQAATWGTSFNTNADHNWTNNSTIQFDTGMATTTGVGISDRLYVQYNIGNFGLGVIGQFEGIGSTFGAIGGTFEYNLIQKYDFKLGVEASAIYNINDKAFETDPGFYAYKKMTLNTYAVMKYLVPVESKGKFQAQGLIYIGVGTTF